MSIRHLLNLRILIIAVITMSVIWALRTYNENGLVVFHGETMGTSYMVKVRGLSYGQKDQIESGIDAVLYRVNHLMSHYIDDSDLSRFNQSAVTDWQKVSSDLFEVVSKAQHVSNLTNGAFDITVAPLIELWGFGRSTHGAFWTEVLPSKTMINKALTQVGFEKLLLNRDNFQLKKRVPHLTINLSAIAKGYGVDKVAEYLIENGLENYLIEIGGEVRVKGEKENNQRWRLAIETPTPNQRGVQQILQLTDIALATSGDYRNFFEKDGIRFSHTLDPRTGFPIKHKLASVTVLTNSTMEADAWATALMVMGAEEGMLFAKTHKLKVLFIIKSEKGFEQKASPALQEMKVMLY